MQKLILMFHAKYHKVGQMYLMNDSCNMVMNMVLHSAQCMENLTSLINFFKAFCVCACVILLISMILYSFLYIQFMSLIFYIHSFNKLF